MDEQMARRRGIVKSAAAAHYMVDLFSKSQSLHLSGFDVAHFFPAFAVTPLLFQSFSGDSRKSFRPESASRSILCQIRLAATACNHLNRQPV
jgi:hypothetical protein